MENSWKTHFLQTFSIHQRIEKEFNDYVQQHHLFDLFIEFLTHCFEYKLDHPREFLKELLDKFSSSNEGEIEVEIESQINSQLKDKLQAGISETQKVIQPLVQIDQETNLETNELLPETAQHSAEHQNADLKCYDEQDDENLLACENQNETLISTPPKSTDALADALKNAPCEFDASNSYRNCSDSMKCEIKCIQLTSNKRKFQANVQDPELNVNNRAKRIVKRKIRYSISCSSHGNLNLLNHFSFDSNF